MLNYIVISLRENNICMYVCIHVKKRYYLKKQFYGFRLGFAATTDSRAARSGARDGISGPTVNFTGDLISANIGYKLTTSVRTFRLYNNRYVEYYCIRTYAGRS